jgi:hypothetical protein
MHNIEEKIQKNYGKLGSDLKKDNKENDKKGGVKI